MTTTISGLQANTLYSLLVYHADDFPSTATVNGTAATDFTGSVGSTGYTDAFDGLADSDFWYFSSVDSGAAGVLTIASTSSGFSTITGFQLQSLGIIAPPVISSLVPADDGTAAVTSDLSLTFTKPIAIGTGNITIKNLTTPRRR